MKRIFYFLLVILLLAGCAKNSADKDKRVIAKINNYEISKDEFEQKFSELSLTHNQGKEAKQEFLDALISKVLIIQDAQAKGLDKKQDFLRMIERFWEHSLVKLALDEKTKEIQASQKVSDEIIKERYEGLVKEGKTDKTFEQLQGQIKREILKEIEGNLVEDWLKKLSEKADIKVNYELLESE